MIGAVLALAVLTAPGPIDCTDSATTAAYRRAALGFRRDLKIARARIGELEAQVEARSPAIPPAATSTAAVQLVVRRSSPIIPIAVGLGAAIAAGVVAGRVGGEEPAVIGAAVGGSAIAGGAVGWAIGWIVLQLAEL